MAHPVDQVQLAFDPTSLQLLNVILGLVMFGVALDLRVSDFHTLLRSPRAPLTGLVCQFLILPALTFGLVWLVAPTPSIALGMILVAACPGGNVSNFITHLAKGNTSVSVGMTAVSTTAAIVTTPLNLAFWGSLYPGTQDLLEEGVRLDPLNMFVTVGALLGIPIVLGMLTAAYLPRVAAVLRTPFKVLSILFFVVFVVGAFGKNFDHFVSWVGIVFVPVLVMNAVALGLGWTAGRLVRVPPADRRAMAIEVGIQNSGLGLILCFNHFDGLGGMAVTAAWWGIWHLIAGLSLAAVWSRIRPAA